MPQLSERFDQALTFARQTHEGQTRKGSGIPYFAHLMAVSAIVLEHGGTEDEAIGALLHDAGEDQGGEPILREIAHQFGEAVAAIVRENSDSLTENPEAKGDWRQRKQAYLAAIAHKSRSALLVSIADKTHNARSLLGDQLALGDGHWSRFNASKKDSAWYYRSLVEAFTIRLNDFPDLERAVIEFGAVVRELEAH